MSDTPGAPAPETAAPVDVASAAPAPEAASAGAAPAETATPAAEIADWRLSIAGDDAATLKALERFSDQKALYKAFTDTQTALRNRKGVEIPGSDATAEQLAAYAEARGVPKTANEYKIEAKPHEATPITPYDADVLKTVTAALHAKGGVLADPLVINEVHRLYYDQVAQTAATRAAMAERAALEAQKTLQTEWGNEYKRNLGYAKGAVTQFGDEAVFSLELADGSLLAENPQFLRLMAAVGRQNSEDPLILELANGSNNPSQTLQAEKDAIMRLRSSDPGKYARAETQARLDAINAALARTRG
jgi:hypothetical protein